MYKNLPSTQKLYMESMQLVFLQLYIVQIIHKVNHTSNYVVQILYLKDLTLSCTTLHTAQSFPSHSKSCALSPRTCAWCANLYQQLVFSFSYIQQMHQLWSSSLLETHRRSIEPRGRGKYGSGEVGFASAGGDQIGWKIQTHLSA